MNSSRGTVALGRDSQGIRLKNPSWRDPKLVMGIVLVLASVVGVVFLILSMNKSIDVYVANQDLEYGQIIDAGDVAVAQVNLGETSEHYHLVADGTVDELHMLRAIKKGELISKASVGESMPAGEQALVLSLPIENISGLEDGDEVELWVAERTGPQQFSDPTKVVTRGTLASVELSQGTLGSASKAQVTIWLPSADIPTVLKSQSNQSHLFLIGRAGADES